MSALLHSLRAFSYVPVLTTSSDQYAQRDNPSLFIRGSILTRTSKVAKLISQRQLSPKTLNRSIYHGFTNFNHAFTPRSWRCQRVQTVHDLIPLLASSSLPKKVQYRFLLERSISRSDVIICVSKWTKDTCEDMFPASRGKCFVIPNGIFKGRLKSPEPGKHLLFVSRFENYKGFDLIVKLTQNLDEGQSVIVVTNQLGKKYLEQKVGSPKNLLVKVAISDDELGKLYRSSSIVIHPSRYEGYCLPASEAIINGKPVIYLSGSGIDETVGDAGIGLSPGAQISDWHSAISSLTKRQKLRDSLLTQDIKNQQNVLKDWADVAQSVLSIYN